MSGLLSWFEMQMAAKAQAAKEAAMKEEAAKGRPTWGWSKLPAEIRNMIYDYMFKYDGPLLVAEVEDWHGAIGLYRYKVFKIGKSSIVWRVVLCTTSRTATDQTHQVWKLDLPFLSLKTTTSSERTTDTSNSSVSIVKFTKKLPRSSTRTTLSESATRPQILPVANTM
jgi:hypothetical protein